MEFKIGTTVVITKVLYIHALWDVGSMGLVTPDGIKASVSRRGYDYIPQEQYLFTNKTVEFVDGDIIFPEG